MLVIVPGAGFCKNDNNNITIGPALIGTPACFALLACSTSNSKSIPLQSCMIPKIT
ncbi:MAG: hypothetical protein ACJ701_05155 [Nitrososphaera sp.]